MPSNVLVPLFQQGGLAEDCQIICNEAAFKRFPNHILVPLRQQGFCSYTILLSRDKTSGCVENDGQTLLQFRPLKFSIDMNLAMAAKETYRELCPTIHQLGNLSFKGQQSVITFRLYQIQPIPGISYSDCLPRTEGGQELERQGRLIHGFAEFIARAWPLTPARSDHQSRELDGKVGSCVISKLSRLSVALPTASLRLHARSVLHKAHILSRLPIVLTHGDVIPSNVIVDPATWELRGLIDWAEAEFLPFGLCLYGLEHFLGFSRPVHPAEPGKTEFVYYDNADDLRQIFFNDLGLLIPQLAVNMELMDAVKLARDVGILLWLGYAWDDGAIDRVINERDETDLMLLIAFLRSKSSCRATL